MPVVRDLADFDRNSGNYSSGYVQQPAGDGDVCALITLALGYVAATRLTLNASFEDDSARPAIHRTPHLPERPADWATQFAWWKKQQRRHL
jgi:hypothetical protein